MRIGDLRQCAARPSRFRTWWCCARLWRVRRRAAIAALLLAMWYVPPALAQSTSGNLTDLVNSGLFAYNGLEIAAAKTNDAAFANLLPICQQAATGAPSAGCTGNTLLLFDRLRELEDTANEILGRGETTFSLRLGLQAVGFALRWTAPEEFAAQRSMTTTFANSQLTTLNGRFSALRFATQMTRLAQAGELDYDADAPKVASYSSGNPRGGASGGGASADGPYAAPTWSAIGNGSYSAGSKAPTSFEDAFNFNDTEYSAGTDVRLSRSLVVGVLGGYSIKHINFNSSESIVDGGVRGEGYSGLVYGQLEGEAAYLNFSLGFQHLSLDTRRAITYPSLNPLIPSVNETSTSSASANSWLANVGGGYAFHWRGFSVEPYLNGQYVHTQIGQFTEHDGNGFDIDVASQSAPSLTLAPGVRLQQVFTPPFGVIVPYLYGEFRHEFEENSHDIQSTYAAAGGGAGGAADFNLPTDAPTRNYYVVGGGFTLLFKHGVQGFVQYVRVLQLTNYSDYVASGGFRIEF